MDLYLQFGYGMKEHCEHLMQQWNGGNVILSPRDLEPKTLPKFCRKLRRLNAQLLFDPQFYLPRADHHRLCSHSYWDTSYETVAHWSGTGCSEQLRKLFELNQTLETEAVILPGVCTDTIDEIWIRKQVQTIQSAQAFEENPHRIIPTVALEHEVFRDLDQVHEVIETTKDWNVSTIYLICEPPNSQYLIEEPLWLTNVIDLVAGLRLSGKKVILGYCSHQLLIAGCASANAIASGTWQNVRCFRPSKFNMAEEDSDSRRTTWYYCPQTLSEYKISTLDLAFQRGMLDELKPAPELLNDEANILFSGAQPTSTGFREPQSFRHYLKAMNVQARQARRETFDETVQSYESLLDDAERRLDALREVGIRDKTRNFQNNIDTNRAALRYLVDYRGVMLSRYWRSLCDT